MALGLSGGATPPGRRRGARGMLLTWARALQDEPKASTEARSELAGGPAAGERGEIDWFAVTLGEGDPRRCRAFRVSGVEPCSTLASVGFGSQRFRVDWVIRHLHRRFGLLGTVRLAAGFDGRV